MNQHSLAHSNLVRQLIQTQIECASSNKGGKTAFYKAGMVGFFFSKHIIIIRTMWYITCMYHMVHPTTARESGVRPVACRPVLTDVASYGNYDPATNALQTPAWQQLNSDERSFFFQLAGPNADERAAQNFFETGTHRWVFIHEMCH